MILPKGEPGKQKKGGGARQRRGLNQLLPLLKKTLQSNRARDPGGSYEEKKAKKEKGEIRNRDGVTWGDSGQAEKKKKKITLGEKKRGTEADKKGELGETS